MQSRLFGRMPDGTAVDAFDIGSASGLSATIIEYGGRIVTLDVPTAAGKRNVNLGFDTLEAWLADKSHLGALTGRYANRIGAGRFVLDGHEYTLPASSQRWFTITDPPGYEPLYFLVSSEPTPRAKSGAVVNPPLVKPPKKMPEPNSADAATPRCDDEMFRSRGDCLDLSAGPHAVDAADPLPENMNAMSGAASRDINVTEEGEAVTVTPAKGAGPAVIYEFSIAHR